MTRWLLLLKNKYVLTLGVFAAILLFVDRNNVFIQASRRQELRSLEEKRKFYQGEIGQTEKQLYDLQHSSHALEKYAREHLLMKKENEDIFIIEPGPADTLNRER